MRIFASTKIVIVILLALFILPLLSRNFIEYNKTLAFFENYKAAYDKELKLNHSLKAQLVLSKSDYEIEKVIRNKLNLLKKGEEMVIVNVPAQKISPTTTPLPPILQWQQAFFE